MNSFEIGNTEFGIGKISLSIENELLTLEINGNDDVFDELMKADDCEWSWALYPPRIYLRSVPYKGEKIVIDSDFLAHYDAALYMMEHNDFTGVLEVADSSIEIHGLVYIDRKASALAVIAERAAV